MVNIGESKNYVVEVDASRLAGVTSKKLAYITPGYAVAWRSLVDTPWSVAGVTGKVELKKEDGTVITDSGDVPLDAASGTATNTSVETSALEALTLELTLSAAPAADTTGKVYIMLEAIHPTEGEEGVNWIR